MQPFILHLSWQPMSPSLPNEGSFRDDLLRLCAAHSPRVEPYNDCEVFLDLTGTPCPKDIIRSLLVYIDERCPLPSARALSPCSVATLARNKLVARIGTLASLDTKKTGLLSPRSPTTNLFHNYITPTQTRGFLSPLSVHYLWPIEKRIRRRLMHLGVLTFRDLDQVPRARLVNEFGSQVGSQLLLLARGIDYAPVESRYPPRTIEVYHEFGKEHARNDLIVLTSVTKQLAHKLAEKLFATGEACQSLLMRMEFASGQSGHSLKLRNATWTKDVLAQGAVRLMQQFAIDTWPYRICLIASDLGQPHSKQPELFLGQHDEMRHRIDKLLASIQSRYGTTAIQYANTLQKGRRERMRALWHDTAR